MTKQELMLQNRNLIELLSTLRDLIDTELEAVTDADDESLAEEYDDEDDDDEVGIDQDGVDDDEELLED